MTLDAARRSVLIIGGSSAIGRAIACHWSAGGSDVLLAGRDCEDLDRTADDLRVRYQNRVHVIPIDSLDFSRHESFWNECLSRCGGELQGVFFLSGALPVQADAEKDLGLLRRTIEVNFTSVASVLTLAANYFQNRGNGFLCVFSSVAGDRGRRSNYVYGSAKAGLSAFCQGLRHRLHGTNVQVMTVKPGFVDTAMTWDLPGLFLVASPASVARTVGEALARGRGEIYTPWFWRPIMFIIRSVPDGLFHRTKL